MTAELVTLKIDGQTVSVPKGTNVLEAARNTGANISYFCYHPGLSSPAVCRQCLVEVKGQPKLVPSCYTPVAENMEVQTKSEKVLVARQQMLEFTLVNHPVDCPICDKAGECSLQKLYAEWDGAHARNDIEKRHKPKVQDLGPTIVLDAERCILCTRCIRVCDEVAHTHQLEMAWRGDREQLTTAPGKQLDNPYSLNTVDVCPVGALTSKDFRFSMRAWELYTTPSVCAGCATGCNIEVHHAKGEIHRLVPRENPAVNKFWMCDEGRLTYKEVRSARVAIATVNGAPASLFDATQEAAKRIEALHSSGAANSIGLVLNAQATNEDNYAAIKAAKSLGITRLYFGGRPDRPERADQILRHQDTNPNSAGVLALANWAESLGFGPAKSAPELCKDLATGSVRGLWMLGDHIAFDQQALAQLDKLDLCIYQSPHDNFIAQHCSIVLPAATWAELDGTITNAKGLTQRLRRAVEPPGEALPHADLISLITSAISASRIEASSRKAIFAEMCTAVPAFANATFDREARPIQLRFAGSRG